MSNNKFKRAFKKPSNSNFYANLKLRSRYGLFNVTFDVKSFTVSFPTYKGDAFVLGVNKFLNPGENIVTLIINGDTPFGKTMKTTPFEERKCIYNYLATHIAAEVAPLLGSAPTDSDLFNLTQRIAHAMYDFLYEDIDVSELIDSVNNSLL